MAMIEQTLLIAEIMRLVPGPFKECVVSSRLLLPSKLTIF